MLCSVLTRRHPSMTVVEKVVLVLTKNQNVLEYFKTLLKRATCSRYLGNIQAAEILGTSAEILIKRGTGQWLSSN